MPHRSLITIYVIQDDSEIFRACLSHDFATVKQLFDDVLMIWMIQDGMS